MYLGYSSFFLSCIAFFSKVIDWLIDFKEGRQEDKSIFFLKVEYICIEKNYTCIICQVTTYV